MSKDIKPCRTTVETLTEKSHFEDEVLESVWEMAESGPVDFNLLVQEIGNEEGIRTMQTDGLLLLKGDIVEFTNAGRVRGRDITRRHLLAERLFADVLDLVEYEEDACRFEHAISPEVEEAICTLLGHPPTCPHGRAIPRGNCCKLYAKKITPLVQSLTDLPVGSSGRVVFITTPMMDRLASMGLVPGATVRLNQKRPSIVIGIDETTIALDTEIARGIYVKA